MYRFDNPVLNEREREQLHILLDDYAVEMIEKLRSAPYEITVIALMQAHIVDYVQYTKKELEDKNG